MIKKVKSDNVKHVMDMQQEDIFVFTSFKF